MTHMRECCPIAIPGKRPHRTTTHLSPLTQITEGQPRRAPSLLATLLGRGRRLDLGRRRAQRGAQRVGAPHVFELGHEAPLVGPPDTRLDGQRRRNRRFWAASGLSSAPERRGRSSRAQGTALSKRAGFWTGGGWAHGHLAASQTTLTKPARLPLLQADVTWRLRRAPLNSPAALVALEYRHLLRVRAGARAR